MIELQMFFDAGTLHDAAWSTGRNYELEWPPAPSRLVEALVGAWQHEGAETLERFLPIVRGLSDSPTFELPRVMSGSSRHPISSRVCSDPNEAVDSALKLDRASTAIAYARWPSATLDEASTAFLETLCARVTTIGGSAAVGLRCSKNATPVDWRYYTTVRPCCEGQEAEGSVTVTRTALRASDDERLRSALRSLHRASTALLMTPMLEQTSYAIHIDDCIVDEQRLSNAAAVFPPRTMLRFRLTAGCGPLPRTTATLAVAQAMRGAVILAYSRVHARPVSKRLAGKADDGTPRAGHDHPYFLPATQSESGKLEVIDVFLPEGCTHDEFVGMTAVRALYDRDALRTSCDVFFDKVLAPATGRIWKSATPVVLDRFPKHRGVGGSRLVDGPADQLASALRRIRLPAADIEVWPSDAKLLVGTESVPLKAFAHRRTDSRPKPLVGATIVFPEPVEGPIVLGSVAHFGLGRFEPVA